jgi:hypothetical protein
MSPYSPDVQFLTSAKASFRSTMSGRSTDQVRLPREAGRDFSVLTVDRPRQGAGKTCLSCDAVSRQPVGQHHSTGDSVRLSGTSVSALTRRRREQAQDAGPIDGLRALVRSELGVEVTHV